MSERARDARAAAKPNGSLRPLRILPIPVNRPPVIHDPDPADTSLAWPRRPERGARYVQAALAVDFAAASDEQAFGPQSTTRGDLPDPRAWAAHLAQALVEVMSGSRPAPQVLRHTTPEVYAVVARRGALSARRGRPATRQARVCKVVVCEPADGVAEVSVVVLDGARVRALALRLVGLDGRWRVEVLQVG